VQNVVGGVEVGHVSLRILGYEASGFSFAEDQAELASAARKSSMISAASTSGSGRLALSSRLSSRSQKMSRLALSRAMSCS
jgi:hypothetical protein